MAETVHVLYDVNMRDMPAMLRALADRIERGEVDARQIACAVETCDDVLIYGWGQSTLLGSLGLLSVASVRLVSCMGA